MKLEVKSSLQKESITFQEQIIKTQEVKMNLQDERIESQEQKIEDQNKTIQNLMIEIGNQGKEMQKIKNHVIKIQSYFTNKFENQEKNHQVQDERIKNVADSIPVLDEKAKIIQLQVNQIKEQSKKMQSLVDETSIVYSQSNFNNATLQKFESQLCTASLKISEQSSRIDSIFATSNHIFTDAYTWKVNNLSKKMEQAEHDCNIGKPLVRSFYTSRGHKLKIELFLNETVFLYFQTQNGVFDDVVKWPMRASINSCVLLNGNALITDSIDTTESEVACSFQNPMHNSGNGELAIHILHGHEVLQKKSITFKIDVNYF